MRVLAQDNEILILHQSKVSLEKNRTFQRQFEHTTKSCVVTDVLQC